MITFAGSTMSAKHVRDISKDLCWNNNLSPQGEEALDFNTMLRHGLSWFFLGLWIFGFFVGHCVAASSPNVILVTLGSLRADRMGFLGSRGGLTPHLDAMAKQSNAFER